MKPYIYTYTGKRINLNEVREDDVCIEDIAHALALCNRFAGHTKFPISVAQHSVYVSRLCRLNPLLGLLHDASEAYLGDMTRWLKHQPGMDYYVQLEERVTNVVYRRFKVLPRKMYVPPWSDFLSEQVTELIRADNLLVRYEMMVGLDKTSTEALNPDEPPVGPGLTDEEKTRVKQAVFVYPTGMLWNVMSWREAEQAFLAEFHRCVNPEKK